MVKEGARSEIDELELPRGDADDDILIFDVAVGHPTGVAVAQRIGDLPEVGARLLLAQTPLLGDEIEEVLASLGPLRHQKEAFGLLKPI
ncbi:hypothetical protein chiPu_0032460 [Chiloscyllium punctatum]|uniref:Uncharacterized protein n=1 Tax=Chiloscyllium punctatum TaxID=137246 RepID=A0A401U0C4_CHIPU|nr:hypothetical protein [Chiloscyllium punctatum]